MKTYLIAVAIFVFGFGVSCNSGNTPENKTVENQEATGTENVEANDVVHLTKETFISEVFDYENNKEWNYKGKVPAIVDFYADWCGPCKMIAPILEELQEEYDGKIQVYKIDTEEEKELASAWGVRSIPMLLFIPMEGKPQMAMGALPKESFEEAIQKVLKVEKP